LPDKWHLEVVRPSISAAAAQRYRQTMCLSCQRRTAVVTLRDLPTLSRTKRRPAAATQALSSGEVPTVVALYASLVTLNEIEGSGRKKTIGFFAVRRKTYGYDGLPENPMVFFLRTAVDRIRHPRCGELHFN